ncbi:Cupredoxin [Mycena floridula]|nr:Cupredoxin [Mycena floridula]
MRFSIAAIALLSSVSSVLSASHIVTVGDNNTLAFNPPQLQVAQGDTVSFEFRSKNHSVTQSTFAAPCAVMTTPKVGVDSGFQLTSNTTNTFAQWTITIDDVSAPLWFFCAQTTPKNHCQAGMVFAINPTAAKSFDAYLANAQNTSNPVGVPAGSGAAATTAVAGATGAASASGFATSALSAPTTVAGAAGAAGAGSLSTSLGSIAATSVPSAAAGLSASDNTGGASSGAIRISTGLSGLVTVVALVSTLLF